MHKAEMEIMLSQLGWLAINEKSGTTIYMHPKCKETSLALWNSGLRVRTGAAGVDLTLEIDLSDISLALIKDSNERNLVSASGLGARNVALRIGDAKLERDEA